MFCHSFIYWIRTQRDVLPKNYKYHAFLNPDSVTLHIVSPVTTEIKKNILLKEILREKNY
jgi:hypothetical protein